MKSMMDILTSVNVLKEAENTVNFEEMSVDELTNYINKKGSSLSKKEIANISYILDKKAKENSTSDKTTTSKQRKPKSELTPEEIQQRKENRIQSWENLIKDLLSGKSTSNSEIVKSIANFANSKGLHSMNFELTKEKLVELIQLSQSEPPKSKNIDKATEARIAKSKSNIEKAQIYLFVLCTPTIIKNYYRWKGYNDSATKEPNEWMNIAWEALTKKPDYLKQKEGKYNPTTIDYLLNLDPVAVENLDPSVLRLQHSTLSYYDLNALNLEKMSLGALKGHFALMYSRYLMGAGIQSNGLYYKVVTEKDEQGNDVKVKKLVKRIGSTSENAAMSSSDDGEGGPNMLDTAQVNQILSTGILIQNADGNELFRDWQSAIQDNKYQIIDNRKKLIKLISDIGNASEVNDDAEIGITTSPAEKVDNILSTTDLRELLMGIFTSLGRESSSNIITAWMKDPDYFIKSISESELRETVEDLMEQLLNKLISLREMAAIVRDKTEMAKAKDSDTFLKIFEDILNECQSNTKYAWLWNNLKDGTEESSHFKFKTIRPIDIVYLWMRNKSLDTKRKFPIIISQYTKSMKNDDLAQDPDLRKFANYFVIVGYKQSSALRYMCFTLYYSFYNSFIRKSLSIRDYNQLSEETAAKVAELIKNSSFGGVPKAVKEKPNKLNNPEQIQKSEPAQNYNYDEFELEL
jgi:hypothetical protein